VIRGRDLLLAHSFTPGGPEIEVLVVAGALAYFGVYLFIRKAAKPFVSVALLAIAAGLGVGAFAAGGTSAASTSARVAITSPRDGDVVAANKPFAVRASVRGARLVTSTQAQGNNVGHLHVYVDGTLVAMPTDTAFNVKLDPGRHTVTIEFTRADHQSFSPQVTDEVQVSAR
jgi:hypothetical protein